MSAVQALLVGCDPSDLPYLRQSLAGQGIEVEAEFAQVSQVLNQVAPAPDHKRLLLIQLESDRDIRQISRLNNTFAGWPIMALLDTYDDPTLVLRAMRAGAAQVISLPLEPEDFETALNRIFRQFGLTSTSRIIALTGASAGCGTTTLAINLAAEIAHLRRVPCILLELSPRLGRFVDYLNLQPTLTTHDLLNAADQLDIGLVRRALVPVGEHFHVIAGPTDGITCARVVPRNAVRLVEHAHRLAEVVVVDMPYTYDEVYFETAFVADAVILAVQQNAPSVHALRTLREALERFGSVGGQEVLINRYDPGLADFSAPRLQALFRLHRVFTVANDWPAFAAAMSHSTVLRRAAPASLALKDIDTLVGALFAPRP